MAMCLDLEFTTLRKITCTTCAESTHRLMEFVNRPEISEQVSRRFHPNLHASAELGGAAVVGVWGGAQRIVWRRGCGGR